MSPTSPKVPSADDIVRSTCAWYDREAAFYAGRTAEYDRFPGLADEILRFTRSVADIGGPVLDLGCGAGRDAEFLLGRGRPVVAGDVSVEMLRATRDRCAPGHIECVRLDMRNLPFAARSLAAAWVCASMVHIPRASVLGCLVELHNALKPGGRVAISMRTGDADRWDSTSRPGSSRWFTYLRPDTLAAAMGASGFADLSTVWSGRENWYITYGSKAPGT